MRPLGRTRHGRASGISRPGALLLVALLLAGVFLGSRLIPPYWTYLAMQDPVKEATFAAAKRDGEAKARESIIRAAQERNLILTDDNIEVVQEGTSLVVRVSWAVPVDLWVYRYTLRFRIEQSTPLP